MLLPLQRGILYGPIHSRRLGRSLGINLMPGNLKLCSFNCVYCHYGWTKKNTTDLSYVAKRLPPVDEVVQAVVGAVKSSMHFDFLTFSGNGEPTLYPHFAEIVGEVVRIRDRYRPEVKIALLSNSSRLVDETIRESVGKIDIPVFKLDAGSEPTFKHINRPAREVNFTKILDTLSSLEDIYIQTMFIQGNPSNVTPEEIMAYFQQLSRIQPKKVHIYSIDRPVPNAEIALVSPKKLEQIAFQGQHETNVPIKPFYLKS